MYLADYHTHTQISPDSEAPLAGMVEAACAAGLSELCVTDHCDLLDETGCPARPWDWGPSLEQFQVYSGPLTLRLGLELGMPHLNPGEAGRICALPELDFIIGSVHNFSPAKGGMDFFFAAYPDEAACHAALDDYFSSVEALISTDYYDVLGHIIYPLRYMPFPISLERWRDRIRGILETVVSKGKGIEVNTYRGRTLEPWLEILMLYHACGGEIVTLGSDAHIPAHVGAGIPQAAELLRAAGFSCVAVYQRRIPHFQPI